MSVRNKITKIFLMGIFTYCMFVFLNPTNAEAFATPDLFADSIYVGGVELDKDEYLESGKTEAVSSFDDVDKSNGYAYYNGNTLMLCDYTYEDAGANPNAIFSNNIPLIGAIKNDGTTQTKLEIVLSGKNSLTHTSTSDPDLYNLFGIYVDGSLEISGSGILNINSPQGIYVKNDLNIKYGKTNIYYGDLTSESKYAEFGIVAEDNIYMNGGTLNVYTDKRVVTPSIKINAGSILVSSNECAFTVAPDFSDYENLKLTVAENADGSSRVFTYNEANIRQYKYLSVQAPAKDAINSIDVNSFTDPIVRSKVSDLGDVELSDDANYSCEDVYIEKKVDDNWVELDSDYTLRYNEDYRVVMYMVPNTGYTFVNDKSLLSVTIPDKEALVYQLDEYADYYCAAVGYEFKFDASGTEVTSFSVNLALPKLGQVYGDLKYSSDNIKCSKGFSYSNFQIYEGITELEKTTALEKGIKYTLVLGFVLENGYYASDIENATINGNDPTYDQFDGNILVLSYEFTITTTPIESIGVTQVKTPNAGEKISSIDTTRFLLGEGYELAEVKYVFEEEECLADTVIEYDKDYSYTFIFKAKEGYGLTSSTAAEINGVSVDYYYDEENDVIEVYYDFVCYSEAIDLVEITAVNLPKVGEKILDVDNSDIIFGEGIELHNFYAWVEDGGPEPDENTVINYDIEYSYTFVFIAKKGYRLSSSTEATVNGDEVDCWYGPYTVGEQEYFEVYYYFTYESDKKLITELEISNYDIPNVGQKFTDVSNTNETLVFGGEYKVIEQILVRKPEGLPYDGEIESDDQYTIFLLLEANEGYKFFSDIDYATFNSDRTYCYVTVENDKKCMVVAYTFFHPELSDKIEINSVEVSNVEIPEYEECILDITNTPDTVLWGEGYEITGLLFHMTEDGNPLYVLEDEEPISFDREYDVAITLQANEGYTFDCLVEKATINGNYAQIVYKDDESITIVYFFSYKTYEIYVADKDEEGNVIEVGITDVNKDDVLGDGTVSYNPKTNTLTLNNYHYEGEGFNIDGGYVAIVADIYENDLTIVLKGENVINITGENTAGIMAFGDCNLYIEGDGSLEINSIMHGIGLEGEFGTIIINGPEIIINSEGAMTTGIWAPNFVMKFGSLKIDSSTFGIVVISDSSRIDINGGSIEISVSVAGNAIAYMDDTMSFVSVSPNLDAYETNYQLIAGTKSDGSNANEYDEELIGAYKYFKISHVCSYGDTWLKNENNHYKECACGEKSAEEAHVDSNNDGKCDVCDHEMPTQSSTPTDPTNPNESKKGLSTGAVVAIVISSVLVISIAGFAIFWFAIKKKNFQDLVNVFKKNK